MGYIQDITFSAPPRGVGKGRQLIACLELNRNGCEWEGGYRISVVRRAIDLRNDDVVSQIVDVRSIYDVPCGAACHKAAGRSNFQHGRQ